MPLPGLPHHRGVEARAGRTAGSTGGRLAAELFCFAYETKRLQLRQRYPALDERQLDQRAYALIERGGIPYRVVRSVAAMIYREPRMTQDLDLVLELAPGQAKQLPALFPETEFNRPPSEVVPGTQAPAVRPRARRGGRRMRHRAHRQAGLVYQRRFA
ncbi:MAG: hypothetical protein IPL40_05760 [Proteobacteria bacterium]|nr:hypothetical protein [Pseudomonadota bacterium]